MYSVTVRLPSHTEYWQTSRLPELGGTVERHGKRYRVVSCTELETDVLVVDAVVELAELDQEAPASAA